VEAPKKDEEVEEIADCWPIGEESRRFGPIGCCPGGPDIFAKMLSEINFLIDYF
jgi:hypothetical protein